MSQEQVEQSFNLLFIFRIIRKYLVYIAGVVVGAGILAFILTLPFIYKPEFKSSTVIYPTSPERYDITNLFHDEPIQYLYGESKDVEKLEHLANSEEIKMFVIDSLNLWEPYGVHPQNDESPKYYVLRTYDGMVQTTRISGNGLMITAYDVEPQRAADIVNLIVSKVDELNKEMLNTNKSSIYNMYKSGYDQLAEQLELYTDSVRNVRKRYNVFTPETQTEVLVEQVLMAESELASAQARLRNMLQMRGQNSTEAEALKREVRVLRSKVYNLVDNNSGSNINLQTFREGLDQVLALEEVCEYLARDIKDAREKVEVMEMMMSEDFTTILITEQAKPSDKKARPIRWIILLATLILAAVVSIAGAILVDKITDSLDEDRLTAKN